LRNALEQPAPLDPQRSRLTTSARQFLGECGHEHAQFVQAVE